MADEAAYCDAFGLTPEQKKAVLDRDWQAMIDLGGSIFYVYKLAMMDGRSMQYLGGVFTGMTEEEFVAACAREGGSMAEVIWGLATSHVPSIGAAMDRGKTDDPYWKPLFDGYAAGPGVDGRAHAGHRDRHLQRPRQRRRPGHRAHLRRSAPPSGTRWPTRASAAARCPT